MNPGRFHRFLISFPVAVALPVATGCGMFLGGCDHKSLPAYSEFVDIDPKLWVPGNPAELTPWPRDSVYGKDPFDLVLSVRYTLAAPDTLYLVTTTEAFDITARNDTLPVILRRPVARPSGIGSFGLYTVSVSVGQGGPVADGLRIAVEPLGPVHGIVSIGLSLYPR